MKCRAYTSSDYQLVANWWEGHELPVTPSDWLDAPGVVVVDGLQPICAGWVFRLGASTMFWIEGIVSNPSSTKKQRIEAVSDLINELEKVARTNGCDLLLGSTPRDGLRETFTKQGFGTAPERYFHLAKRVGV